MEAKDIETHVLSQVGWNARRVGDEHHGEGPVLPELLVAGSPHLRVAMLLCWSDHVMGMPAVYALMPRVPATLDLEVNLYRPAPGAGKVRGRGRLLKTGRSVVTGAVAFADEQGEVFAEGTGSFAVAGDPNLRMPETISLERPPREPTLAMPIAQRIGLIRRGPGQVELARSEDGLNSSNTVHGGLLALLAEEAALSLVDGSTLSSLSVRYLRPVRVGPVRATARVRNGLAMIELHDAGAQDRLAVTATARIFER